MEQVFSGIGWISGWKTSVSVADLGLNGLGANNPETPQTVEVYYRTWRPATPRLAATFRLRPLSRREPLVEGRRRRANSGKMVAVVRVPVAVMTVRRRLCRVFLSPDGKRQLCQWVIVEVAAAARSFSRAFDPSLNHVLKLTAPGHSVMLGLIPFCIDGEPRFPDSRCS